MLAVLYFPDPAATISSAVISPTGYVNAPFPLLVSFTVNASFFCKHLNVGCIPVLAYKLVLLFPVRNLPNAPYPVTWIPYPFPVSLVHNVVAFPGVLLSLQTVYPILRFHILYLLYSSYTKHLRLL